MENVTGVEIVVREIPLPGEKDPQKFLITVRFSDGKEISVPVKDIESIRITGTPVSISPLTPIK